MAFYTTITCYNEVGNSLKISNCTILRFTFRLKILSPFDFKISITLKLIPSESTSSIVCNLDNPQSHRVRSSTCKVYKLRLGYLEEIYLVQHMVSDAGAGTVLRFLSLGSELSESRIGGLESVCSISLVTQIVGGGLRDSSSIAEALRS